MGLSQYIVYLLQTYVGPHWVAISFACFGAFSSGVSFLPSPQPSDRPYYHFMFHALQWFAFNSGRSIGVNISRAAQTTQAVQPNVVNVEAAPAPKGDPTAAPAVLQPPKSGTASK